MSTYINNKLFTYVASYDIAKRHSSTIKDNYPNSLVFIGDERIIWQPLTNAYIGLGSTAYSYLNTWINNTYAYAEAAHQRLTIDKINGVIPDATNKNITFNTSHPDLATFTDNTNSDLSNSNTIQLNLDGLYSKLSADGKNSKDFAVENTTKQINTLYQLLLGADKDPANIYVEHELNHFFDPTTDEVFNKAGLFIDAVGDGQHYIPVNLAYIGKDENNHNQYKIIDGDNNVYETFTVDSNGDIIKVTGGPSTLTHGTELISKNTPDNTEDDVISYIIYSRPTGKTNSYAPNISITDSIDTIREIAYILDVITDGNSDDSISLVYNIVKNHTDLIDEISYRKAEDTNIRNEMVKGISISGNPYLNVVELNSYTYNGLKTGAITSQLSINVAEAVNHQVGWFDSSDNWHWIYENHSDYAYTQALQVGPDSLDDETLSYYYNAKTGDGKYIIYHDENSTNSPDPNSYLYTRNTDQKTFKKHTDNLGNVNRPFIEIKPYEDKYQFDTNGNLSNGDKLLTTVDWVSSYVAVLKNEFDALDVDNDISSYLTDNDKFKKLTYNIEKNSSAYNIITSLKPVITNEGIKIQATSISAVEDVINIDIKRNDDADNKKFNVTCNSNLHASDNGYPYTIHNLHLSYTLLTDTLATPTSLENACWSGYDGFASAYDVSLTFTNMFTWYNAVDGTVYGS